MKKKKYFVIGGLALIIIIYAIKWFNKSPEFAHYDIYELIGSLIAIVTVCVLIFGAIKYWLKYLNFTKTNNETMGLEKYEEIDDSKMSDEEKAKIFGVVLELEGQLQKSDITRIYNELIEKYHPSRVQNLDIIYQIYAKKKTKNINKAYSYFKAKYNL